jgi:threonine/homoserine efflux transporter RhtA
MNKNQIVGAKIFDLFLNFEPVIIILLAWIVIGKDLSIEHIAGIALFVFALLLSHWKIRRLKPQPTGAP